jgi:hypothetical protein
MLVEVNGKVYRRVSNITESICTDEINSAYNKKRIKLGLCSEPRGTYEEVTYFKTNREYWEWLLEGNKVCPIESPNDTILYMREDVLYLYNNNMEFEITINYNIPYMYKPYIEPSWYTNIPEKGIFCWVNNFHNDRKDYIALIKEYDITRDNKFVEFRSEARVVAFKFATPLTKEELLERCYASLTDRDFERSR